MSEKSHKSLLPTNHVISVFEDTNHFFKNCISYTGPKDHSALCSSEESDHKIVENDHQAESFKCTICNIYFENRDDQRQHYFSDLHRVNAHRKASLKPPLTEEEFLDYIDESSNSESESDDISPSCEKLNENIEFQPRNRGNFFSNHPLKTFYVTEQKILFSIYKNLIIQTENFECLDFGSVWVYLLLCAGHFAGAVFNKNETVAHKTFHRYVVRAKSGTAQSVCDNQGGNAPKSAGSSLRRYNEAALKKEIQELLLTWSDHINASNRIFYKCSTYGMGTLFGKKTNISKDDRRLCKISLPTQRPTLNEIKRLHLQYSRIYIHGSFGEIEEDMKKVKEQENKERLKDDVESLKQELEQSNLKENTQFIVQAAEEKFSSSERDTKHAQIYGTKNSPIIEKQVIASRHDSKERNSSDYENYENKKIHNDGKKEENNDDAVWMWNPIYKWCSQGNLNELKKFFETISDSKSELHQSFLQDNKSSEHHSNLQYDSESKEYQSCPQNDIVNKEYQNSQDGQNSENKKLCFYPHINYLSVSKNSTLLQRAIVTGSREIVALLLDLGADPSISNTIGQLPYDLASQNIRREFRRFRYDYPNKYDYAKAKIGTPLTKVEEERKKETDIKKKKLQNKARKEKLKLQKMQEEDLKKVEQEKQVFENLSDREKRAVMAERRIATQHTTSSRCARCRAAIDDKNAFEKYGFKYCCMKCVNEHKSFIGK
ncbi:tRNA endonuclease ANKZF1 isoform X3 [Hydra vulgaris]|uniref:tRNA endonuclease ANKZF1 isoform X3 n=1 Tax=Hydra vulgaris TaxID=6087 RepID=A0ABM4CXS3_HYDVU